MRFMIIRKADKVTEAETSPVPSGYEQVFTDMAQYNEELLQAGMLLGGEGLHPSAKGARFMRTGGKGTVIDGPFAEAKELIAGFTMIKANSLAEALEWVKRWPASDGDVVLEVRQVYEAEDFGPEFTPELREQEERQRIQAEKLKQS